MISPSELITTHTLVGISYAHLKVVKPWDISAFLSFYRAGS